MAKEIFRLPISHNGNSLVLQFSTSEIPLKPKKISCENTYTFFDTYEKYKNAEVVGLLHRRVIKLVAETFNEETKTLVSMSVWVYKPKDHISLTKLIHENGIYDMSKRDRLQAPRW
ncbi:MAG: hypothetical protein FWB72_06865 [Firmicutes bacterium]|nr:hypothetical protein [Bacillota bacterium]